MVWRNKTAPGQANLGQEPVQYFTSKTKILMGVAACLVIIIGTVALQPRTNPHITPIPRASVEPAPAPTPVPAFDVTAAAPTPAPPAVVEPAPAPEPQVSRADASLLELRQSVASRDASHLLRQPVIGNGGTQQPVDLPKVTTSVLAGFGYFVRPGDRLHALLVQALSEQKSNAFIDALLNTAAARGEFVPPFQLRTSTGRLDTQTLLQAIVRQART